MQLRPAIRRRVDRKAGQLLRFETVDDLEQEVFVEILSSEFIYRSEPELVAFVSTVADRVLSARRRYWSARKRDAGRLIRLQPADSGSAGEMQLTASWTGPSTFAARRESLISLAQSIDLLGERDKRLVQSFASGEEIEDIARVLGLQPGAASQARSRALARLGRIYKRIAPEETL